MTHIDCDYDLEVGRQCAEKMAEPYVSGEQQDRNGDDLGADAL
jgi:hypothetical protein